MMLLRTVLVIGLLLSGVARADETDSTGRIVSASAVGLLYGGFSTWAYFAWYHNEPDLPFHFGGDGYFGQDTYAGGADKLGHLWAGYALGRVTSQVLRAGGWPRMGSSLVGAGLSLTLFTLVEVKDGYHYQFSPGDQIGNVVGAGLAVLMENFPEIDRRFDFRVEYVPSPDFRRLLRDEGDIDIANDYSGQMYFLAYHLGSVRALEWSWLKYVDVGIGYRTRNYKPTPLHERHRPRQELFWGISLNVQEVAASLMGRQNRWARGVHHVTEYLAVPYTTLPLGKVTRKTLEAPPDQR